MKYVRNYLHFNNAASLVNSYKLNIRTYLIATVSGDVSNIKGYKEWENDLNNRSGIGYCLIVSGSLITWGCN